MQTDMPDKFWMVYGAGKGCPRVTHDTIESARAEAKRLARQQLDTTFFIMSAVQAFRVTEINWYELK